MESLQTVERATDTHILLIMWMVNELRKGGYDYVAADHISEPIEKPFPISGAVPDLYATGRGWTLLVEVERFDSLTGRVNRGNWEIFNREALRPRTKFWIVVSEEDAQLAKKVCEDLGLVKAKVYPVDLSKLEELQKVSRKPKVRKALEKRFQGEADLSRIEIRIRQIPNTEERWKKRDEVAAVLRTGGEPEKRPRGYRTKTKRNELIPFPAGIDFSFAMRWRRMSVLRWFMLSTIVSVAALGLLIFVIVQLVQGTYGWATLGEALGTIFLIFSHFPFYNRFREELSAMLDS